MKKVILSVFFFALILSASYAQTTNIPVLRANSGKFKAYISGSVNEDELSFSDVKSDTIDIAFYLDPLDFGFFTDLDSLHVNIPLNETFMLKVQKEGAYPLFIKVKNGIDFGYTEFDTQNLNSNYRFAYESGTGNPYLQKLKDKYALDSIAAQGKTDIEKVKLMSSWVNGLWKHDGWNVPEKRDALYILEQVEQGKRFRCVEYGIVTTACLNAIGMPSRTLALKTKIVETTTEGAGHVVMEVFLKDQNKWVMVDPQWNTIPYLDNVALNAVEFQQAVTEKKKVEVWSGQSEIEASQYIAWIYPYLYYYSVKFDNRENISNDERIRIDGKSDVMLVPIGAKNPTAFQVKYPIDYCVYTNSILDFYRSPNGK